MKKDIDFGAVEGISVAIATQTNELGEPIWNVYLLNNNSYPLDNVLVTSKGYGTLEGNEVKTSVLRHMFEKVEAKSFVQIEPIDPAIFHINNEYWVSYYVDKQIFDKKFVFVPDSIKEEHLIDISMLQMQGILHS
jgi:DNA topoisomerase IB